MQNTRQITMSITTIAILVLFLSHPVKGQVFPYHQIPVVFADNSSEKVLAVTQPTPQKPKEETNQNAKNSKKTAKKTTKKNVKNSNPAQGTLFSSFWWLKLNQDQRQQLRMIADELREKLKEYHPDKDGKPAKKLPGQQRAFQMGKLRREAFDKALTVLTDEQQAKLILKLKYRKNIFGPESGKPLRNGILEEVSKTSVYANKCTKLPENIIDQIAKPAGSICNDETFIRRVYIDLIGATPTVDQVLEFLNDQDNNKRIKLIDKLIKTPEFANYQTMHWCDTLRVKSEFPIKLWPNGTAVYHRWIRESIRNNKPYDEFAREMITASGSNFRNPAVNFYRANQGNDAQSIASATALTFLGSRINNWPVERQQDFQKIFKYVAFKGTSEWKEEIVYWNRQNREDFAVTMPDGSKINITADKDPRRVFADWLINDNDQFADAAVNRIWNWLFGKGIVHEPDDFRADNPPTNPELLNLLRTKFVESDYNMKKIYRLIVSSRTYQQESPAYPPRPVDAETIQDTFCRIFGTQVSYSSDVPEPFSFYPKGLATMMVPDGTITNPLLQTFGRPSRDTGLESDRSNSMTKDQRLFLINSTELNSWITQSWILRILPMDKNGQEKSLQYLWLKTLSRYPTEDELHKADGILHSDVPKLEALQDIVWMLINTKEFSLRH